jgi:diguanylate cyclase
MSYAPSSMQLNTRTLVQIIRTQTEIAKLGLDLGGVMAFVAERVQTMMKANGAVVELAEGEEMVYRAGSGICAAQLGLRLKHKGSLSGLCVDMGSVLRCDDAEIDSRVDREACRRVGFRSMMVAPLKHAGIAVGVLKVTGATVAAFNNADAEILELMSEVVSASMFHTARYGANDLYVQATLDALTGLPNKALFFDRLRQVFHLAQRQATKLGVLLLDVDSLSAINETCGYRAGDAAIQEVGGRIRKTARRSDTVARIGDDEFAVILPGVGGLSDVEIQAGRIVETVQTPFSFEERDLDLDVSVGMAIFPEAGADIIALIAHARKALADAKRARAKPREAEVQESGPKIVPLLAPLAPPMPKPAARVQ